MGKHKTANKGVHQCTEGCLPLPSSQDGEDGNMVQDPIEEIVSGDNDALSYTGTSPIMPFRFRVTKRLPSERPVSTEHQQDHSPTS